MSFSLTEVRFVDSVEVTDYVANGSFASLKENVSYKSEPDFAVLARLVDHNAGWKGHRVYVDEKAYKFLSKSSLTTGDVVIANVGANAGTVFQVPALDTPITLGPNAVRVRPKGKDLDRDFLYYYLSSPIGQDKLQSIITGSAQPKFNKTALRGLSIRLPSFSYQRQTVELVKALDDRITLLRETNATLEAIAQALFKSWFVDFDPVRAKMEGRAPEGMDETTAALFPDSFEESELGLVPRGWSASPLAEAFEINPSRKLPKGSIASYLDMASLLTSGHCVEPPIQREMGSGAKFQNGDTLLARITPCLENGKSAFVDFLAEGQVGWGSTEFLVLRPKAPLPEYLGYLLCRHPAFREYAIQSMSGTSGRQRIQNDVLGRYLLAVPDREVAVAFGKIVGPVQQSIAANHQTAQTLATLRDTLLPRLISGQLRLPEAQAAAEEALA